MHEPHVRLASMYRNPHRDRAAVRIPDHPARGFRSQHPDAVHAQAPRGGQEAGAAPAACLLVGHEHQPDPPVERHTKALQRHGGVQHGGQAALHVRAPAAEERLAAEHRRALSRYGHGHHIVVTRKVERLLTRANAAQQDRGTRLVSLPFASPVRHTLTWQSEVAQSRLDEPQAGRVSDPGGFSDATAMSSLVKSTISSRKSPTQASTADADLPRVCSVVWLLTCRATA